jgi:hypothetical protein
VKIFRAAKLADEILREDDRSAKYFARETPFAESHAASSLLHFKIAVLISAARCGKRAGVSRRHPIDATDGEVELPHVTAPALGGR